MYSFSIIIIHLSIVYVFLMKYIFNLVVSYTGLPHTQGTQGIQGISGNFQVEENLKETQGNLINFLNSGKF